MTNVHVLENKISAIRGYLHTLERYKQYPADHIKRDVDIRGALERYLYLATQSCIDLAEAVISYKEFRKPTSMREAFSILNEQGLIPTDLTEKLIGMVGFRNVIAHDYADIDYDKVCKVLHHDLADLEQFLAVVTDLF